MQRRQNGDKPNIDMIHSKAPGGLTKLNVERPADVAIHLFDGGDLMVDNAKGNGSTCFAKGDPATLLDGMGAPFQGDLEAWLRDTG